MNKWFIIIPLFLIAAVGAGVLGAYAQIKKQPSNSLKIIRTAINDHDVETFNKFVDVDKILETAAAEILAEKINEDKTAYSMQQASNVYNNEMKPDFINVTKNAVAEYIKNGQVTFNKDSMTNAQRWLKKSEINAYVIESMSKPVYSGDTANAVVYFRNNELKFSFELELELEKFDKNKWRIIGVKGFEDYNKALKRALGKKLDSLNAPIRSQLAEIVNVKDLKAIIGPGDEYGFSQTLKIALKADVKSSKPLARIVGKILIDGENDNESATPFVIDMAYHPQGLQTFNIDKVLNPFVREDVNIMKRGLRRNAIHAEIDEVDYLDGTQLKTLDKLPD